MRPLPSLPISWPAPALALGARSVVLALLLVGHAAMAADPRASRFYEDALGRYQKQDFAGAVVQLKNALQVDRRLLPVHELLGRALLAQGNAPAAEVALREALSLGASRGEVAVPLARALIAQGRQQELLNDQALALTGLPASVQFQLHLYRSGAQADLGDSREALRSIEAARALDPSLPESWTAEVPLHIRANRLELATAAVGQALARAPEDAEAHYLRGQIAHLNGRLADARAAYDRALQLQPEHTEALVTRAGLALDSQDLAAAMADVAALRKASPADPRGAYLAALIAEREGKPQVARAALNEATAILDAAPPAYLRFRPQLLILGGMAHVGLKQNIKAKPYLEAALRQQPASPAAKVLANILLSENNTSAAVQVLETYLRGNPRDSQALLMLSSAHLAQGRHGRAVQLTQEALREPGAGDQQDVRTLLGLGLLGSGRFGEAVQELEKVLEKEPGQLRAGSALINLYLQGGQARKALAIAEPMAKRHAQNPGVQFLLGEVKARLEDRKGARAALGTALQLDPKLSAASVLLAQVEAADGAAAQAVARLNAVLAQEPSHVAALSEMARIAEARGQLDEARRLFAKADDVRPPAQLQPGLELIDFHLRRGQPLDAKNVQRRLESQAPEAIPVLMSSARISLALGDAPSARPTLTRAATLAARDAVSLTRIGLMQISASDLQGAAYTLGKVLEVQPDYLPAAAALAEVEWRSGDGTKAEARARRLLARHPRLGVGHALLGDIAASRGQTPAAIDHYRKAHQIEPSSASMLRLFRQQARRDAAEAIKSAESWLASRPDDTVIRRALADAQAARGAFAQARRHYEILLKNAPEDAEALNNLANVLILNKDPAALQIANRALALKPEAAHIIGTAGWAAHLAGDGDRALQLLRDARLRAPDNPDTRYFLASVLAAQGRKDEARAELQPMLSQRKVDFQNAAAAQALLKTLSP